MLTKEEIKNITKFNLPILEEGIRQAEQRLKDSLNSKENLEKKAFTLLTIFFSFSAALFSVTKILNITDKIVYFFIILTGLFFLLAAIFLFRSLRPRDYGTLGRYPDTWLQEGILDGDDDMKAYVLANILHDYQETINSSEESNSKKRKRVDTGIILGIISSILLCISNIISFSPFLLNFICHLCG